MTLFARFAPALVVAAPIAVLLLVTASAPAIAAGHPSTRQGFFIGLGAGGGSAALTEGGETSDREVGPTGSIRAGFALSPIVGAGFEGSRWFATIDDVDWTFTTSTASVFFYAFSGLVLRGGVGAGSISAEVESGSTTLTESTSGLGVSAAVAYEFRLMRTFAIGPQIDYGFISTDEADGDFFGVSLVTNWYFIPR